MQLKSPMYIANLCIKHNLNGKGVQKIANKKFTFLKKELHFNI